LGLKIMLLRSNNDTGPGELTTTWFKLLGASIAVLLMAREAARVPSRLGRSSNLCF
jgi:hypothetical protein